MGRWPGSGLQEEKSLARGGKEGGIKAPGTTDCWPTGESLWWLTYIMYFIDCNGSLSSVKFTQFFFSNVSRDTISQVCFFRFASICEANVANSV